MTVTHPCTSACSLDPQSHDDTRICTGRPCCDMFHYHRRREWSDIHPHLRTDRPHVTRQQRDSTQQQPTRLLYSLLTHRCSLFRRDRVHIQRCKYRWSCRRCYDIDRLYIATETENIRWGLQTQNHSPTNNLHTTTQTQSIANVHLCMIDVCQTHSWA